jgi:Uma2 family endonuclease
MATVVRKAVGQTVLHGVAYDDYVKYRLDPKNDHLRMTYHNGWLALISPALRHERPAEHLGMIVRAVAAVFAIPYLVSRCTTMRRGVPGTQLGSGKEPDNSFYFAHLAAVRGKDEIDLETDPPPDLWIEVDNRSSSVGRLPLFAALGVPEVWRYRARRGTLWLGRLEGDRYEEIDRSVSLPMLTPAVALDLLAKAAQAPDDGSWDEQTRDWLRQVLRPEFEARG